MRIATIVMTLMAVSAIARGADAAEAREKQADDFVLCKNGRYGMSLKDQVAPCSRAIEGRHLRKADLAVALTSRCTLLSQTGELERALADCNRAIGLSPKSPSAYEERATVREEMGELDEAIADVTRAIQYDPTPAFDYLDRMRYFNDRAERERFFEDKKVQRRADYDRAQADGSMVLAAQPPAGANDQAKMALELIKQWAREEMVKAQQGKTELAKGSIDPRIWCRGQAPPQEGPPFERIDLGCTAVIDTKTMTAPDKADAHFRRGLAFVEESVDLTYYRGGIFDDRPQPVADSSASRAISDFQEAIRMGANTAHAHYGIATVQMGRHQDADAVSEFSKAIEGGAAEDLPHYYGLRGEANFYAGAFDNALSDLTKSLDLKQDDLVMTDRSIVRAAKHDYEGALADCNQAVILAKDNTSDSARIEKACGDIAFLKTDYMSAISAYDRSVALSEANHVTSSDAVYARGCAKIRAGMKDGGQSDIDAAIKQTPDVASRAATRGISP